MYKCVGLLLTHGVKPMHQLTYTHANTGETTTEVGRAFRDEDNSLIFETEHESRPNFRIEADEVILLSAGTDVEVTNHGTNPSISGYCVIHDLDYDSINGYDYCPQCRVQRDREAALAERMSRRPPRSVDDPAPYGSYDAW